MTPRDQYSSSRRGSRKEEVVGTRWVRHVRREEDKV